MGESKEEMGDKVEAGRFLRNFKEKMKVFNVLFLDDRGKNSRTLAMLEITPMARRKVLESLETEDYSAGPIADTMMSGGDLWVFGKMVKNQEVYIKITLGIPGSGVICISFHIAEYPMKYPFRSP